MTAASRPTGSILGAGGPSGAVASAALVAAVASVVLPPAAECAPSVAACATGGGDPFCAGELFVGPSDDAVDAAGPQKRMSQLRLKKDIYSGEKRMSQMRLKKSDDEADEVEKRMSQMRLKKMSQMRLKKGGLNGEVVEAMYEDEDMQPMDKRLSQMRLKKDVAWDPSKRMSQMRLKKMSQMRLKKMSQMRLKRPSYMRLRRGPSMMRLKKSPEEVDCVWVRGICIDSAEVELLNQLYQLAEPLHASY